MHARDERVGGQHEVLARRRLQQRRIVAKPEADWAGERGEESARSVHLRWGGGTFGSRFGYLRAEGPAPALLADLRPHVAGRRPKDRRPRHRAPNALPLPPKKEAIRRWRQTDCAWVRRGVRRLISFRTGKKYRGELMRLCGKALLSNRLRAIIAFLEWKYQGE